MNHVKLQNFKRLQKLALTTLSYSLALLLFGSVLSCKGDPKVDPCMPDVGKFTCNNKKQDVSFTAMNGWECLSPIAHNELYVDCVDDKGWRDVTWCTFKSAGTVFLCSDGKTLSYAEGRQFLCFHPRDVFKMQKVCEARK